MRDLGSERSPCRAPWTKLNEFWAKRGTGDAMERLLGASHRFAHADAGIRQGGLRMRLSLRAFSYGVLRRVFRVAAAQLAIRRLRVCWPYWHYEITAE